MIVSVFFRESSNQGTSEGGVCDVDDSEAAVKLGKISKRQTHLQKPVDPNLCWTFLFWFFIDIWLKPQARIYGDLSMFAFTSSDFIHCHLRPFGDIATKPHEITWNFNCWIEICVLFVSFLYFVALIFFIISFSTSRHFSKKFDVLNLLFSIKFFVFAQKPRKPIGMNFKK